MLDPRMTKLAETLVNYSCALKGGDRILIEAIDVPHEFTAELVRVAAQGGGKPLVTLKSNQVNRALMLAGGEESWGLVGQVEKLRMENVQCYIGARGNPNVSELSDVPAEKQKTYEANVWKPVHIDVRCKKTRWVVLRWPSPSMAQLAGMSTEAFEDFYFRVCTMDYAKMSKAIPPLKRRMEAADKVHIMGPGPTDLKFSIRGIAAIPCDGARNIPDGEIFTAPVRNSVNGVIQYNTPTLYRGVTHENVRLVFREGKIVEGSSSATAQLQEVLDTDEGARYVGEFAIGFHPYITRAMKDILFDEKIAGSIHFTPGSCYEETENGNRSQIHWDMVLIQTPDYGGGELWFDGELIRKDGRFVPADLQPLNPENLR
jgi:aminopeptidase